MLHTTSTGTAESLLRSQSLLQEGAGSIVLGHLVRVSEHWQVQQS